MKYTQKVKVKNIMGLHTRPATAIVKILQNCKCDVYFTYKNETINAKSILSILMLAAKRNTSLTIQAEGEDAEDILEKLVEGFKTCFGDSFKKQ